jgi:hypothetical protein
MMLIVGACVSMGAWAQGGADEGLLWRQTFATDGPNHNLAGVSADPREFFGKVSDPTRMTWAVTDAAADASIDDATAATVGERFVMARSGVEGELMLESEGYDGLVTLLNALPPGRYGLTMATTLRDRGRHVRRIQFQVHDRPGKSRWESRWINPKVGDRFEEDRRVFTLVVLEPGVEPTAGEVTEARGEDEAAVVFVAGSLQRVRTTHWVGSEGQPGSVALAQIAFFGKEIAAVAAADPSKMLTIASVSTPGTVFMYHRSSPGAMTATLSNQSPRPMSVDAVVRVTPWSGGASLDERRASVRVPAGGQAEVAYTPDASVMAEWPYGVYVASWQLTDAGTGKAVAEKSVQFGVGSDTELGKARAGEFLFGLDTSLFPAHTIHPAGLAEPPLLAWTRWMGADIVRGGFFGWSQNFRDHTVEERLEEVRRGRALYERYDLQVVKQLDPPDDKFLKDMERIESRMVAFAEAVAREHAGWLTYYELGNEPDLPGFYEGPMSRYVRQYLDLHAAIHRGNPEAIVMNGGFAYREDRIAEFLSSVRPDQIEAIAYHAHGKGSAAEREGFRRVRGIASEHGLGDKPLIQTESGLSAGNRRQELEKARTCIQKMVYAQSQDVPLFLWFRLYMNNRSLGNTRDMVQPRPVVLAYRAMVEALRHHRFERVIESDDPQAELYAFREVDGPGRVVVGWSNEPGAEGTLRLDLGSSESAVSGVAMWDMFGNASALSVERGGSVAMPVGESPRFLRWASAETDDVVATDPGFVPSPRSIELVPGRENRVAITVRNPWAEAMSGRLSVASTSSTALRIEPSSREVELGPGESKEVGFAVTSGARASGLAWPTAWTVFARVAPEAVEQAGLGSIPEALPGADGRPVEGVRSHPRHHTIDLAALGAYRRKVDTRAEAVVMAEVVSDRDRVVTMGAAGDWWMAWYVNGRPVYDTMAGGNGASFSIAAHTFEVPLRKGRNVLAARVLAGSHGWRLVIGPPEPVRRALGEPASDRLAVTLSAGGREVYDGALPIAFREPLPRVGAGLMSADGAGLAEALAALAPAAVLTDRHVRNYYERVPGDARWWNGDDDLSATVWLGQDASSLIVVVRVEDQDHAPAADRAGLAEHDHVVLALADESGASVRVVRCGGAWVDGEVGATGVVGRDDAAGVTTYRVAVPWDALAEAGVSGEALRLNVGVYDRDAETLKQHAQWRAGLTEPRRPGDWALLHLEP